MDLEQLRAGVCNTRVVTLYGKNLRLRVLSEAEHSQCRADALAHRDQAGLDQEGMLVDQVIRQLYVALDDGEGGKLAPTVIVFKQQLSRPEREYLTGQYLELEQECSPDLNNMTKDQFEALVEDVKKNPDSILNPSNISMLKKLVRYLESQSVN